MELKLLKTRKRKLLAELDDIDKKLKAHEEESRVQQILASISKKLDQKEISSVFFFEPTTLRARLNERKLKWESMR
jgi:hypothetical protein